MFTVITKKLLVMSAVITKKVTGYVHCCYKENYLICLLLLQRIYVMITVVTKKNTYVHCCCKKIFVMFTVNAKTIICFAHCYYKEYCLLYSLLLPRKILVMFTVVTKITCYVHFYLKKNTQLLVIVLLLPRELLVVFTVVTKKMTGYFHCYYKENYLSCSLLL